MVNYKKLTWDIKCLKKHSHIDLDNDHQFSKKMTQVKMLVLVSVLKSARK